MNPVSESVRRVCFTVCWAVPVPEHDKMLVNASLVRGLSEGLRYERTESPGSGPDMAERLKQFGR